MNSTPQPWSFHDDPPPRKPRRRVLYAVWGAAIVAAAGWSLAWLFMMGQVEQRLDAGAAALKAAGWRVSWSARHVGGYPFRLDVDLSNLNLADPSGWAASAPLVKSEAYGFAPDRWVFYLPAGLAFTRPGAGAVTVAAKALRGSVNGWGGTPLRISVEGDELTFAPAPGAKPFPLASAANVQFYTRPGPDDQGAIYMTVAGGAAAGGTWLDRFAQGKAVGLTFDAIASHASAFSGPTLGAGVAGWSKTGGALQVRNLAVNASGASVQAASPALSLSPDGRLEGALTAKTAEPGRLLAAFGSAAQAPTSSAASLVFTFKDGRTFVGDDDLGPAPGVF